MPTAPLPGPLSITNRNTLLVVFLLIIAAVAWFFYARQRSAPPVQSAEEVTAQKAAGDAAKAENPFKAANPLGEVEANPFEKAKKVLNPFE